MQTKRFGLCAVLSAAALLLLAGCAGSGSTAAPTLTVESSYPLQYAKQFTVDKCPGGYELITIADSQYLVVPQGAAVPEDLPQGTTVLQQPIENIYLVSTSAMDPIISLGALDSIALSGTKADGWYLPEAKAGIWTRPGRPCWTGALPMRASTAPRTMKPFWLPAVDLPLKTR